MKSGNSCYHLVQNLWSSILLSKNINITIYRTVILPVVLHGSLKMRKEHKLTVSENRAWSRIFETKRDKVRGEWRRLHTEDLVYL